MTIISGKKCLLDTNILVFAQDLTSSYHKQAIDIFQEIEKQSFHCYIAAQSLIELSAVLTRAYKIPQNEVVLDIELLRDNKEVTILYQTQAVLQTFLQFMRQNTGVYVYDLMIAAIAKTYDLDYIISNDADFERIKEIKRYNPFRQ